MDGDEWSVLEAFIYANNGDGSLLRRVKQISIQSRCFYCPLHLYSTTFLLRFFYGEENEVSRAHYRLHVLLLWAGFEMYQQRRVPYWPKYTGKVRVSVEGVLP